VAAGGHHACAIQEEDLWCWGWNQQGQLGLGTTLTRNTPGLTSWQ